VNLGVFESLWRDPVNTLILHYPSLIVEDSLLRFEEIGVRMVPALSYLEPEVI